MGISQSSDAGGRRYDEPFDAVGSSLPNASFDPQNVDGNRKRTGVHQQERRRGAGHGSPSLRKNVKMMCVALKRSVLYVRSR